MGHQARLLAGAKRCLRERGYARTTARDIVAASGTNLASIGYHFGSKEALLDAAMMEAIAEWGDELRRTLATSLRPGSTPLARFTAVWAGIIRSFEAHRPLWVATIEALAQSERSSEVRQFLAEALQRGREGLVGLFHVEATPESNVETRTIGSLYQALLTGVGVQWLVDPVRAPSAGDLTIAIRTLLEDMNAGGHRVGTAEPRNGQKEERAEQRRERGRKRNR